MPLLKCPVPGHQAKEERAAEAEKAASLAAAAATKQAAKATAKAKRDAALTRGNAAVAQLQHAFDHIRLLRSLNAWRSATKVRRVGPTWLDVKR